ncbi:four helix bundle protein [Nitrospira sp. BLG_2]|uniref:four helix bundle protein n=1 Tax=Nitrospira sp. BLG_2 TaxID=3397507 RepID=UPI003B99EEE0
MRRDIDERTFRFAVRIVKMARALPQDFASQVVVRQVTRCGTSVGANVEEAQGSHSRAEFIRRMGIARSESREAFYWLRLISETGLAKRSKLESITKESEELVRILTAIVKNTRKV